MRTYSTKEAARLVNIHWVTLLKWLAAGKIHPSIAVPINGGRTLWRWTEADVKKLRNYKKRFYGTGKGPKPKKGKRR
jgi:excisionase family DNA binding protein